MMMQAAVVVEIVQPVAQEQIVAAKAEPPEVYVWGRRDQQIGRAASASEGSVSNRDFADRPLLRPGELVEVMPGVAATQHSGEGKANQYFLRGFNLDHGTDFSVFYDGVPLNMRTNAHGQGYLDLNGVTPELIANVSYRKGTYYADVGDFSAAGTASFLTYSRLPNSFIRIAGGGHDYGRLMGAFKLSRTAWVAVDATRNNGPWMPGEDLKRISVTGRYTLGDWNLSGLYYNSRWNSADQIPMRAVAGGLSPYGVIDPTDGGRTERLLLSLRRAGEGSDLVVYAQSYRLGLWSNFTYFLDDPINGDQFEQSEQRYVLGGSARKSWELTDTLRLAVGGEVRYDDIGKIGLYRTRSRVRLSTDREDSVSQVSAAGWARVNWTHEALRGTLGARVETMSVDVTSDNAVNSGHESAAQLSPKATVSWRVTPEVEVYGDWGQGFHSNDARGVTTRISPQGDPTDPAPIFARATGGEVGARYERHHFQASVVLWKLDLASELIYVGDGGGTETTPPSRRQGVEFLVNYHLTHSVNFDLMYAATRSRYANGDRIANALEYVATGGVTIQPTPKSRWQVTVRHLGPAPLIEDNSVRSKTSTLVNLAFSYDFGRVKLGIDAMNLFDRKGNDIAYYYTSRLNGEPSGGVDDLHFHPQEPRQFRVGLSWDL